MNGEYFTSLYLNLICSTDAVINLAIINLLNSMESDYSSYKYDQFTQRQNILTPTDNSSKRNYKAESKIM